MIKCTGTDKSLTNMRQAADIPVTEGDEALSPEDKIERIIETLKKISEAEGISHYITTPSPPCILPQFHVVICPVKRLKVNALPAPHGYECERQAF